MKETQVKKLIAEEGMKAFDKFMKGQTVGIDKDKNIDYYEQDVERFITVFKRRLLL